MTCPEPGCSAEAHYDLIDVGSFRVHESMNVGGVTWAEPDEGHVELLDVIEVACDEGHRFRGPAEAFPTLTLTERP